MEISSLKVTIPQLDPEEKQGLQDYWAVYEAHRDEVTAHIAQMALQHPEFKFILHPAPFRNGFFCATLKW